MTGKTTRLPTSERRRLDDRKFSFSQRTVNEWNKLSADCVHSSSIDMFKNRIDNYRIRTGYMWTLDKPIDGFLFAAI